MRDHWWQWWKPKGNNPGSREAALAGCLCPVTVNNAGAKRPAKGWLVREVCPIHGKLEKGARPVREAGRDG